MPKISDFFVQPKSSFKTGVLSSIEVVDGKLKMSFIVGTKTYKTSISLKTEKSTSYAGYILSRMCEIKGVSKDAEIADLLGVEVPVAFKRNGEFTEMILFPKNDSDSVPF